MNNKINNLKTLVSDYEKECKNHILYEITIGYARFVFYQHENLAKYCNKLMESVNHKKLSENGKKQLLDNLKITYNVLNDIFNTYNDL